MGAENCQQSSRTCGEPGGGGEVAGVGTAAVRMKDVGDTPGKATRHV